MIIDYDVTKDLLEEEEVQAIVKALGKGHRSSNPTTLTDVELVKALDLFRHMKLNMLIMEMLLENELSMKWQEDDWVFNKDNSTIEFPIPTQTFNEG